MYTGTEQLDKWMMAGDKSLSELEFTCKYEEGSRTICVVAQWTWRHWYEMFSLV